MTEWLQAGIRPGALWGDELSNIHHILQIPAREIGATEDEICRWTYNLAYGLAGVFEFCAKGTGTGAMHLPGFYAYLTKPTGTTAIEIHDPCRDFFEVLKDVQANRVQICPICDSFFYATRVDKKACSKQCNDVRRMRESRLKQSQLKQTRKPKSAGLKP